MIQANDTFFFSFGGGGGLTVEISTLIIDSWIVSSHSRRFASIYNRTLYKEFVKWLAP